jgi:valyl-tRNA synthetase
LAEPALKAVLDEEVEFYPKKYVNTYRHWLENVRDWCISRQLWWGHRIPAWYHGDEVFVAETATEALAQAKSRLGDHISLEDLKQDEDVLDTWFSSWLWPISVFDGFNSREELDYYYPTSVLVTGWDIIFLWVARMIMAGYEWESKFPFKHVYFTGMVRDQQRRKMSKSLGNSPDALNLIEEFGADGVRFGMLSCSPAGGDLLFDEALCDQGKKFCNKMWNGLRAVKGWSISQDKETSASDLFAIHWIENRLQEIHQENEEAYKTYRLSEILKRLYSFIWNDFFSQYLEMIKPADKVVSKDVFNSTIAVYSKICTMLHPFMPFITEELWHQLDKRAEGDDCMMSQNLLVQDIDKQVLADCSDLQSIVSAVRDVRNKNQLAWNTPIELFAMKTDHTTYLQGMTGWDELIKKMTLAPALNLIDKEPEDAVSFIVGTDKYFVTFEKEIDVEAELKKLEEDLEYQTGFVSSVEKKLSNERFVNNAPAIVVDKERQKMADGQKRIQQIKETIDKLRG